MGVIFSRASSDNEHDDSPSVQNEQELASRKEQNYDDMKVEDTDDDDSNGRESFKSSQDVNEPEKDAAENGDNNTAYRHKVAYQWQKLCHEVELIDYLSHYNEARHIEKRTLRGKLREEWKRHIEEIERSFGWNPYTRRYVR